MNKLILLGLLAFFLTAINGEYYCDDWKTLYSSSNLEDLEGEDCAMLTPTGQGMTHCCLFEIGEGNRTCREISDDMYENIGRYVKWVEDQHDITDVEIDCSSKFLSLSLFVIFALLF